MAAAGGAAAAPVRGVLPEVGADVLAQAAALAAVVDHGVEPGEILPAHRLLLGGGHVGIGLAVVDHPLGSDDVLLAEEQHALRRLAVPPGAARLLIVGLHGAWHVVVDDEAHVALVDAHAEGVGGHHDLHPVVLEVLLAGTAFLVRKPRVVASGGEAVLPEPLADLLHILAGGAVNDAAVPHFVPEDHAQRVVAALGLNHLEVQVGPVEAREGQRGPPQAQKADDVLPHPVGGRGGEGPYRRPHRQAVHKVRDAPVIRAEVLPPLGDAVGLVHSDEGDPRLPCKLPEGCGVQSLGSHVDHPVHAQARPLRGQIHLPGRQGAVQVGRGNPRALQGRHLILHQGDQRGNHQRHAIKHQRGNLVAQALARAGGHHAQAVPALKQRIHQHFLPRTEAVVAEVVLQRLQLVHCAAPPFVKSDPYCSAIPGQKKGNAGNKPPCRRIPSREGRRRRCRHRYSGGSM